MTFASRTRPGQRSVTVTSVPTDRPLLARRLPLWPLVAVDTVAAVGLTAAHVAFTYVDDNQPSFTGPEWLGWLVAALAAMPLAVRRLWPVPALALTVIGAAAATILNAQREPWIPVVCVLYVLAVAGRRSWTLVAALTAGFVACLVNYLTTPQPISDPAGVFAFYAATAVAVWMSGLVVHTRRDYASRVVTEEKLRIARELHDVMAHSMSLIAVKAGIANHVAAERPEEAREALRIIEETSRATLNDMRRMLGVLRSETSLAPAPSVSSLPSLADRARAAGVDVTMTVTLGEVSSALGMSVYRIVQESLTNVVKHAGPVRCSVSVVASDGEVRVDVEDDGPGGSVGVGHGLIGMRERVAMYGGTFDAGPRPGGGFMVSARIPLAE
jgi:signal transduction histidine kinase